MSQPNPRKWLFQPKWQLLLMTGLLALLVVPFNLAFSADWVIAGSFQNELPGAPCGDWDNSCAATTMEDTNGDGVSRLVADGLPAGSYEYKVVELGNWGNAHPANNVAIAPLPVLPARPRWPVTTTRAWTWTTVTTAVTAIARNWSNRGERSSVLPAGEPMLAVARITPPTNRGSE